MHLLLLLSSCLWFVRCKSATMHFRQARNPFQLQTEAMSKTLASQRSFLFGQSNDSSISSKFSLEMLHRHFRLYFFPNFIALPFKLLVRIGFTHNDILNAVWCSFFVSATPSKGVTSACDRQRALTSIAVANEAFRETFEFYRRWAG
jgi:hypothetical protein